MSSISPGDSIRLFLYRITHPPTGHPAPTRGCNRSFPLLNNLFFPSPRATRHPLSPLPLDFFGWWSGGEGGGGGRHQRDLWGAGASSWLRPLHPLRPVAATACFHPLGVVGLGVYDSRKKGEEEGGVITISFSFSTIFYMLISFFLGRISFSSGLGLWPRDAIYGAAGQLPPLD